MTLLSNNFLMRTGCPRQGTTRPGFYPGVGWVTLLALIIAAGCATKQPSESQVALGNDVTECRQIVAESLLAVKTTLLSVNTVAALTNACSTTLLQHLTTDIHRLKVDSFKVRVRAQAMRARGPAYFEEWHANLQEAKEPELRQRAEQTRTLLQNNFDKIREAAQPTREGFRPFLSSIRKLRNELEKNAASMQNEPTKELVKSALENGERVQKGLGSILEELSLAEALLKPVQTAAK
jgi:hypothetical protein